MQLSSALANVSINRLTEFDNLSQLLCPELISQCLESNGVATLRKRKLPMESMVWAVVGMALFRNQSMRQLINRLDIMLPNEIDYVAPSAVTQARKRLGSDSIRDIFRASQAKWNEQSEHPTWCGLNLYGVDGVVWRTPDTPENNAEFERTSNHRSKAAYPQVRMVCLMELSSHLVVDSAFDSVSENEMTLAARLLDSIPENSLTLFDRGFYSLGLLDRWHNNECNRHWLMPLKKNTQYEVIRSLGRQDKIIRIATSPQAKKKWEGLSSHVEVRLLSKTIKGKSVEIITSMTDPMKYPAADIVDLYAHRWEIELGYREMKQYLLENRFTLRSNQPELIRQELWGILLAYNLLRYKMVLMAKSLDGIYPNQLSFREASAHIVHLLSQLPSCSPGNIPKLVMNLEKNAKQFVLPGRRERSYPRVLKCSKNKFPVRKRNAVHLK